MTTKYPKPICVLTGTDGNVFAVIGAVRECLKQTYVFSDKEKEFTKRAMAAESYEQVFQIAAEYVEIK